ncbi:cysteine rich repeat-containing protein [Tardiphaga sp. 813_E8_N1_3]|uniref:cysteine rich repeat-containing protein n=1 Tax=Tardiphaga sp. 813_E8_N1_3 TaxID=3240760 RepID=UPI003F232538
MSALMMGIQKVKLIIFLGIAVCLADQTAIAKSELTDPLKIARDCKSELKRLCAGVRPGRGRITSCLKEKSAELSSTCLDALKAAE